MPTARIFELARRTPDKTAVVHNGVGYTYARFARRIEGARQYLRRQQLPVGTVAAVRAESLFDAWVLGFALRSLGLHTIAATADPLAKLGLRNLGCVVTMADEPHQLSEGLSDSARRRMIRVPVDGQPAVAPGTVPTVPELNEHPGGHIMMTSGTTGVYKKILRDAKIEAVAIPLHAEINALSENSVVYVANFPLWTAGGYRWPLITWSVGGTVIIHQAMDLHQPLADHELTHVFTTPDALSRLIDASKGNLRRNDATRLLVTGGAMSKALLTMARRRLTHQVYSVLASTEALTIGVTPLVEPDDLLWHRIHPSREVQIVDEADRVLGPRQTGFIRVRIIDGLEGYLDDEVATRAFFRDGYFYPGDLGAFGVDGRLSLRGRVSDVINILGNKVATGPIERALQDRLGAVGVCIVAVPGEGTEEAIHLVIQSGRPMEMAEVNAIANVELGLIKQVPVQVVFVEQLPRNEAGKIQRLVLKMQLSQAQSGGRGPSA